MGNVWDGAAAAALRDALARELAALLEGEGETPARRGLPGAGDAPGWVVKQEEGAVYVCWYAATDDPRVRGEGDVDALWRERTAHLARYAERLRAAGYGVAEVRLAHYWTGELGSLKVRAPEAGAR